MLTFISRNEREISSSHSYADIEFILFRISFEVLN